MKKALLLIALLTLTATPAFADRTVTGDYAGKTKCENGMKKAGFKDPLSQNTVYYSLNEISRSEKALSWPDDEHPMSFDEREKQKTQLHHVLKVLHDLNCDTQDNPAQQGNGLGQGAQNGTSNPIANPTVNGTTQNGYQMQQPKQGE